MLIGIWGANGCRQSAGPIAFAAVTEIPWENNILIRSGIAISVSSYSSQVHSADMIRDNDPETFWQLDDEMCWLPAWVEVDCGTGNALAVVAVAARPRRGFGSQFFRNAQIQASDDGVAWETITWTRLGREPRDQIWYLCTFDNKRTYRFWRFLILNGYWGQGRNFCSLADLAMF